MAQVTNQDVRSGSESEAIFHKYRPLPPRGIRLLELLPPASRRGAEIHCNIVDFSLDQNVQYEALSYCWGTVKPDKQGLTVVNYGNHRFSITDSLAEAFRQFRFKDTSRYIWADFICINQKHDKEKGVQVGMMTDIYDQASGTLAWLGLSTPQDDPIFEPSILDQNAKRTGRDFKLMMALGKFLERDWFSRMWIIQEAAIAKKLTLCCGEKAMDWTRFYHLLERMLTEHGFFLNTSRTDAGLERIISMISIRNLVTEHVNVHTKGVTDFRVLDIDRMDQKRPKAIVKPGDFTRFLAHSRLFSATDQRDRVYALRGLVLHDEKGDAPEYETKKTPQVFEEFTHSSIQYNRNLDVLSQAGIHGNSLPSFVADWSCRLRSHALPVEFYRASPMEAVYEKSPPGTLVLTGQRVDQIAQLLPGFNNNADQHLSHANDRKKPWAAGEQPSHEKLELFERGVSESLDVLLPLADIAQGGKTGLVKNTPKLVKELVTKATHIPGAMSDRTKRVTIEDDNRWRSAALQPNTAKQYQDPLAAYRETLLGSMPIPALSHELNTRYRALMYEMWRERSAENPIVTKNSVKGKTKTEDPEVDCPPELKVVFYDGIGKKNSDMGSDNRDRFKQTGGNANFPVLTDRKMYETTKGIKNLFKGQKNEPSEEHLSEYEKKVAYYDHADPYFKARDSRETKQFMARLYSRQVERMAGHRRFAITQSGFMGWVPEISREGDEVWVLDGGKVPFILRPSAEGDGYQLVGEAYVQGLMFGEWFKSKAQEEILNRREKIVLV
jgi:hypothetical protein